VRIVANREGRKGTGWIAVQRSGIEGIGVAEMDGPVFERIVPEGQALESKLIGMYRNIAIRYGPADTDRHDTQRMGRACQVGALGATVRVRYFCNLEMSGSFNIFEEGI